MWLWTAAQQISGDHGGYILGVTTPTALQLTLWHALVVRQEEQRHGAGATQVSSSSLTSSPLSGLASRSRRKSSRMASSSDSSSRTFSKWQARRFRI